jgi:ribosomal protein L16/L10AE
MNSNATDQIFMKFSLKLHTHIYIYAQSIQAADRATGNETL